MKGSPPDLIAIDHDDYHASHVGKTPDGRQFFLTNPFIPASNGSAGREFLALYIFESDGRLIEARIDDLGIRANFDQPRAQRLHEQRMSELGAVSFERIEVEPFEIERFDTTFGLVLRVPETEDDVWAVELMPGNYMAFFEPWDSGDYDT